MVFCGKASRSCANCRAVKRRCDQKLPQCGQCLRLRENCPGYRDEWDLVFRNQTDHIIKRSKTKWAKRSAVSAPTPVKASGLPLTRRLSPNVDEIGVNYFLHNFVTGGQAPSRGYLNYVPSVYLAGGEHPTLLASMAAVGLVALANATQQPELAGQAQAKYSEAIRQVNMALASPVDSVKDSTLLSVISLGVFERISGHESWIQHVQGAAALVVARGKTQFSSPTAIRMFAQVRADLVLACLYVATPFPRDMLELQDEAALHTDTSCPLWLLGVASTRCTNLLMRVKKNYLDGAVPWSKFLEEAIVVERDFEYALKLLALQEPYTTIQEDSGELDPNIAYHGRFDLYHDCWAIKFWNNSRSVLMILGEILCFLLNQALLAPDLVPETREPLSVKLQETLQTMSKLGTDVLATVPQVLKLVSSASGAPRPPVDLTFHGSVSGGYMLAWWLYTVGKCVVTTSEARKWIIHRLQHIGQKTGVSIAAELVEDIVQIDEWVDH
ncbi:hypothetical protein ASPZODRAFT_72833 [Penicilliopsis zonata CBS 506.65]|uniref:Zn(2)-C6 fungal-type domain-containing protein n=1 Tax=Penicilliopsis zonata CBS 506.65 TaxID=1073090 RepID=A0A1L9S9T5_9EURO|nr:hypothetical protein ASPZODRAFT_72833 [Penicilliopsis zonata CBS 506.65]OJJ43935.1 hypothetical protein ASPZODRAFT_72833 [Penicilliopsis zonata CBS 506.65]